MVKRPFVDHVNRGLHAIGVTILAGLVLLILISFLDIYV